MRRPSLTDGATRCRSCAPTSRFTKRPGDATLARICRGLLRQAGAAVPRTRGDTVVPADLKALGVTSRELDVLRLVTAGLSNQAISERLFLSPRTVETHVANLLGKTGSANRHELRAWSLTQ